MKTLRQSTLHQPMIEIHVSAPVLTVTLKSKFFSLSVIFLKASLKKQDKIKQTKTLGSISAIYSYASPCFDSKSVLRATGIDIGSEIPRGKGKMYKFKPTLDGYPISHDHRR